MSEKWLDVDICTNCLLSCSKCDRIKPNWVKGNNITIENFRKICVGFKNIALRGTYGDAIYHPQLHKLLQIALEYGCNIKLDTNGHGKSDEWWDTTFDIASKFNSFIFTFALDGLPEESEMYRVGQDGEAVFEIMKKGSSKGLDIRWQYIVFSYNENHIEEAKKLAEDNNIKISIMSSSRWSLNDPLKPSTHYIDSEQKFRNVDKLYPKCLYKQLFPVYTIYDQVLPCCVIKSVDNELLKKMFDMKLSNFKVIKDIMESKEWKEFYRILEEEPQNAPATCKAFCGTAWKFKEYE